VYCYLQVLHSTLTKHPDGLAVDWVGRNLYWCDNLLNTIEVSTLSGSMRKILISNVQEPRALQLHPSKAIMFYTDWGQNPHIGRANMDGTDRREIVNNSIGNAVALSKNLVNLRL